MALERDLRDYLFENPEVLFPDQVIEQKRREVYIEGRFIDLLFEVQGTHYIIELKRDTIRRETIGQIFEYYGLMRRCHKTANFKMILVAPSIPDFRRIPLEEFGIRCVEVPLPAGSTRVPIEITTSAIRKQIGGSASWQSEQLYISPEQINFKTMNPPASRVSWQISQMLLRDSLPSIVRDYSEYEIKPVPMRSPKTQDVLCFPSASSDSTSFIHGGAWWAYSFGHIENMPKNDVPNISVNTLPWGLDFAVNAELHSSQAVMLRKIASATFVFDRLVEHHGNLRFQAWLKLEHQPRFYHWIPLVQKTQGTWSGRDLIDLYRNSSTEFSKLREKWIEWIKHHRLNLTDAQAAQMKRSNQKLNLALRLVHSFQEGDKLWNCPYQEQLEYFNSAYRKLKPLIDFFQSDAAI